MIHTLKCPSCSAPLDHDDGDTSRTIRCPFCNNTMIVPDALRRTRSLPALPSQKRSALPFLIGGVVVAVVLVAGVAITIAISSLRPERVANDSPPPRRALDIPRPPSPEASPSPAGFASVALKFGSEGTGAGTFTDARHVAVDGAGRIYVGEYSGGRVQVFDPAGKFITQWIADAKMPMRGLAADRKGTVYVVQRGKIERREGESGKLLGEVQYPEGSGFDDLTVTADGGLVAAWHHHRRDDIVRFDAAGRVTKVIKSAISGQTDGSELQTGVAVDGAGNIYALGSFNYAVFKFSPDGRFVNKFGGEGNGAGQFRAPLSIAADHRGRVYVSDFKGVQVFDGDGRYLTVFKPSSIAFGMVFNDNKELFVAARTQVVKLALNDP